MFEILKFLRDAFAGQDRIRKAIAASTLTQRQLEQERLRRVKALERNAKQSATNFRTAHLYEAARIEAEKAQVLAAERRRLEEERTDAERQAELMRLKALRKPYGLNGP